MDPDDELGPVADDELGPVEVKDEAEPVHSAAETEWPAWREEKLDVPQAVQGVRHDVTVPTTDIVAGAQGPGATHGDLVYDVDPQAAGARAARERFPTSFALVGRMAQALGQKGRMPDAVDQGEDEDTSWLAPAARAVAPARNAFRNIGNEIDTASEEHPLAAGAGSFIGGTPRAMALGAIMPGAPADAGFGTRLAYGAGGGALVGGIGGADETAPDDTLGQGLTNIGEGALGGALVGSGGEALSTGLGAVARSPRLQKWADMLRLGGRGETLPEIRTTERTTPGGTHAAAEDLRASGLQDGLIPPSIATQEERALELQRTSGQRIGDMLDRVAGAEPQATPALPAPAEPQRPPPDPDAVLRSLTMEAPAAAPSIREESTNPGAGRRGRAAPPVRSARTPWGTDDPGAVDPSDVEMLDAPPWESPRPRTPDPEYADRTPEQQRAAFEDARDEVARNAARRNAGTADTLPGGGGPYRGGPAPPGAPLGRVDMQQVVDGLQRDRDVARMLRSPVEAQRTAAQRVVQEMQSLLESEPYVTPQRLQEVKDALREGARFESRTASPGAVGYQAAYTASNVALDAAVDRAAAAGVPGVDSGELQGARRDYRVATRTRDVAHDRGMRELTNRLASPTDYLAGMAGAQRGGLGGGIAAGVLNHVVRGREKLGAARGLEGVMGAARAAEPTVRAMVPAYASRAGNAVRQMAQALMQRANGGDSQAAADHFRMAGQDDTYRAEAGSDEER